MASTISIFFPKKYLIDTDNISVTIINVRYTIHIFTFVKCIIQLLSVVIKQFIRLKCITVIRLFADKTQIHQKINIKHNNNKRKSSVQRVLHLYLLTKNFLSIIFYTINIFIP